jgi:XTP/dITP diphosphohydrolase
VLGLKDIECYEDIPETAHTLEGNAIQKADYVTEKFGLDCFADDTGLEVEALNGAPGVISARYAGSQKDAGDNIRKLLSELDGASNRKARFRTVIALNANGSQHLFEGIVEGEITPELRGGSGFGYDPVFMPEGRMKTFAEMGMPEKNSISHRARAVEKLVQFLNKQKQI